ncbi:MAG: ABC transporter substrate-binding protein, partial [Planctomycetota bacterium]
MRTIKMLIVILLINLCLTSLNALTYGQQTFSPSPEKYEGRQWRIGYYQGGDYMDYKNVLVST